MNDLLKQKFCCVCRSSDIDPLQEVIYNNETYCCIGCFFQNEDVLNYCDELNVLHEKVKEKNIIDRLLDIVVDLEDKL